MSINDFWLTKAQLPTTTICSASFQVHGMSQIFDLFME